MDRTLIVSGGSILPHFLLGLFEKNSYTNIIAVDNGIQALDEVEILPTYLVGDFDTASPVLVNKYENLIKSKVIRLKPEKDETDTSVAIALAISLKSKEVTIVGGLGGSRMDHSLANVHQLMQLLNNGIFACLLNEKCKIYLANHAFCIEKKNCYGKYVSLLPLTEQVIGITLNGMKYPLKNAILTIGDSLGVSNEMIDDVAEISFEKGTLIIIEAND